jgi:23S rRNA (adenine2503-C2)-methyltransferase
MINFRNYLNSKGIISTIRTSRGEDIKAACGMLATTGGAAPLNQNSKK